MKNTLQDLNNHLFAQLERLTDEGLTDEQLEHEIKRSKSVVSVAHTIVDNTRVQVDIYIRFTMIIKHMQTIQMMHCLRHSAKCLE